MKPIQFDVNGLQINKNWEGELSRQSGQLIANPQTLLYCMITSLHIHSSPFDIGNYGASAEIEPAPSSLYNGRTRWKWLARRWVGM